MGPTKSSSSRRSRVRLEQIAVFLFYYYYYYNDDDDDVWLPSSCSFSFFFSLGWGSALTRAQHMAHKMSQVYVLVFGSSSSFCLDRGDTHTQRLCGTWQPRLGHELCVCTCDKKKKKKEEDEREKARKKANWERGTSSTQHKDCAFLSSSSFVAGCKWCYRSIWVRSFIHSSRHPGSSFIFIYFR